MRSYSQKRDECTDAVKYLYLDKVKGLITDDEFISFSKEFHEDKNRLESLLSDNKKELEVLEKKIEIADDRTNLIKQYLDIEKLEREHIETLINCIYVGKRNAITKVIPIEIQWNF